MDIDPLNESPCLLFKILPYPDESLTGFLMRLASANFLKSPAAILSYVSARPQSPTLSRPLHFARLARLARLTLTELDTLSGMHTRTIDGEPMIQFAGGLIAKRRFYKPRNPAVCPDCLRAAGYFRDVWSLTYYTACPWHGNRLVAHCPNCNKPVFWLRSSTLCCSCGQDWRHVQPAVAHPAELWLASLILLVLGRTTLLSNHDTVPPSMVIRLASLSLNGLLATIWFAGALIPAWSENRPLSGQEKLSAYASTEVIVRAVQFLNDWPSAFYRTLEKHRPPASQRQRYLAEARFGPIHRFLTEDHCSAESLFLRLAYERYVRTLWHALGRRHPPAPFSMQLEFDFDLSLSMGQS